MSSITCVTLLVLSVHSSAKFADGLVSRDTPLHDEVPEPKLPDGFALETLLPELDRPTAMAFAPNGRIFIALKNGVIRVLQEGWLDPRPLADLRNEVSEWNERGLLGMALDPAFADNGFIYLNFIYDRPDEAPDQQPMRRGKVARFVVRNGALDRASEVTLVDGFENLDSTHSVGALRFDAAGNLYAGFGDGSGSFEQTDDSLRVQDLNYLNGKVIRIDPQTGCGVADNPFYDPNLPCSVRSRVWAYGFRYPYRISINPKTQALYVSDVGWMTNEMVRVVVAGANFGWPCVDANTDVAQMQAKPACVGVNTKTVMLPNYTYNHNKQAAAIIGGDFNVGKHFPAEMRGDFFFGDYAVGFIRRATLDARGQIQRVTPFAEAVGHPSDIQFGPDGALYILTIYPSSLKRVVYLPANHAPVAAFTLKASTGATYSSADTDNIVAVAPFTLTLDAAASSDIESGRLKYRWYPGVNESDAGRAPNLTRKTVTQVYRQPGLYVVRLAVTDANGWSASAVKKLYLLKSGAEQSAQSKISNTTSTGIMRLPLDGSIRTWWMAGSFPNRTLSMDALAASPLRWPGGESTYFANAGVLSEKLIESGSARVDLSKSVETAPNNLTYAFIWVESEVAQDGYLGIAADAGVAIWLNGDEIWRNETPQTVSDTEPEVDHVAIQLKKGWNPLLVKLDQKQDPWAFKVRLLSKDNEVLQPMPHVWLRTHYTSGQ